MSWVDCVVDNDYEICDEYPYYIRRKSNKRIIKERPDKDGYIRCLLNNKDYRKHRIVAIQFLDNPNNYTEVDHINRIRTDYHLSNLRFVSRSENNKNKSSNIGVVYEYKDKIDDEAIEITDYGNHHFEFYYYVEAEDSFYYYTGVNYRKLHINIDKRDGRAYISIRNNDNKQTCIFLNKFKRLYGIDF